MNKHELREHMMTTLRNMPNEEIKKIHHKIMTQLFLTEVWKKSLKIGITLSFRYEWDTFPIIERAWSVGKQICVPKTNSETKQLIFYELKQMEDTEVGFAQLLEPNPERTKRVDPNDIDL